jgi:hypothetical protein
MVPHVALCRVRDDGLGGCSPWPRFEPGTWTPHITTGWELTNERLARALPLVLDHLPIEGWLDQGGVEDGTTGEKWTSPELRASETGGDVQPQRSRPVSWSGWTDYLVGLLAVT